MTDIDKRLGKIVQLAKHGVGGEKENALKLVKQICQREGLMFEDVMSEDGAIREYPIYYGTNEERIVAMHVIARFALTPEKMEVWEAKNKITGRRAVVFACTAQRYAETSQAWHVYLRAFRAERRKMLSTLPRAFARRHDLYLTFSLPDRERPQPDLKKMEAEERLAEGMDEVHFHTAIGSGARQ